MVEKVPHNLSNDMFHCSLLIPTPASNKHSPQLRSSGLITASNWNAYPSNIHMRLPFPLISFILKCHLIREVTQSKKQPKALTMHADLLSSYHLLHFTLYVYMYIRIYIYIYVCNNLLSSSPSRM